MHKEALRITVASQLLGNICGVDSTKSAAQREPQLRNALEVAEALIRLGSGGEIPTLEYEPPLLPLAKPVEERDVERPPPLREILEQRRAPQVPAPQPTRKPRGPTFH